MADQGVCYLYLGGTQTVTDGALTLVFASLGLYTITA
jgi:hypothetical protein